MAVKNIPAQKIVICDRCGKTKEREFGWVHDSKLTLTRAGLDFQGCAVADASLRYDLCDRCSDFLASAITKAMKQEPTP